jgi:hypothetical protein
MAASLTGWLVVAGPAAAERFANSYISFELPTGWACRLEQTEWVCRPTDPVGAREAIFILTAKETGPQDRLHLYEDHLARPMVLERGAQPGSGTLSTVLDLVRRSIGGRNWVIATHFQSEVRNYITRYFATADDQIAILFTFSAHSDHFDRWGAAILPTLESIEARRPR